MITLRKSEDRGRMKIDWLDSRFSFSFAEYRDPEHVHFGPLRVLNEDRIAPASGFPTHGHQDMEIVTYILSGALTHRDSLSTGSTIRPGEVQRMSAGTGIQHSEFNASRDEPVHLLQIWIIPERRGEAPAYEQKAFDAEKVKNAFYPIVVPRAHAAAHPDAVSIGQDASIYAARLEGGTAASLALAPGRRAWVQLCSGAVALNGTQLAAGDGAAVVDEARLEAAAAAPSELLLFDLPDFP